MTTLHKALTHATGASLWALWTTSANAHDGHGLSGSHWHSSDAWGFVAFAVLAAIGIWLSRGGK